MNENQKRSAHFLSCLGVLEKIHPIRGGKPGSPFTVLEISPTGTTQSGKRVGWTYITSGMSTLPQPCQDNWVCPPGVNLELMLYCRRASEQAIATLEELANFPFDAGSCLAQGQVLPTDDPTEHGYTGYTLLSPHREAASFSPLPFQIREREVCVLWVFPLLPAEVDFGTIAGGAALEELIRAQSPKPFFDLARKAIVTREDVEAAKARKEQARIAEESAKPQGKRDKTKTTKLKLAITGIFGRDKAVRDSGVKATALPDPTKGDAPATKPAKKPKERVRDPAEDGLSLEQAAARLAEAMEAEASAAGQARSLRETLQGIQEELRELRPAIKAAEGKRTGSLNSRKELDLSLEKAQSDLAGEKERLAGMTREHDQARAELDTMSEVTTAAASQVRERKAEKARMAESLAEVKGQLTAGSKKAQSAKALVDETEKEAAKLEARAEELARHAKAAAKAAETARTAATAARAAMDEHEEESKALAERDRTLRAERKRIEASIAGAAKELESREEARAAQEARVAELANQGTPDTTRFDELTVTVATLGEELASVKTSMTDAESELKSMRSRKSKAVVEEQKLDSKIQDALLKADRAKEALDSAQKLFERLETTAMEEARQEAEAAQAQVEEMQRALDEAKVKAEQKLRQAQGKGLGGVAQAGSESASDPESDSEGAKSKRLERLQIIKDSMMKDKKA